MGEFKNDLQNNLESNSDLELKIEQKIKKLQDSVIKNHLISKESLAQLLDFWNNINIQDIKQETSWELDNLKNELKALTWETSNFDYEDIYNQLVEIKKLKLALELKNEIDSLKSEIEKEKFYGWNYTKKDLLIWKYLSDETIRQINNPNNVSQNLKWLSIWLFESIAITWKLWYDLIIWLIKTFNDLYKIISWKAEYEWFKNI